MIGGKESDSVQHGLDKLMSEFYTSRSSWSYIIIRGLPNRLDFDYGAFQTVI